MGAETAGAEQARGIAGRPQTVAPRAVAWWKAELEAGREPTIAACSRALGCDRQAARPALISAGLITPQGALGNAAKLAAKGIDARTAGRVALDGPAARVAGAVFAGAKAAGVSVSEAAVGLVLAEVVSGQRKDIQRSSEAAGDLLGQVRELCRPAMDAKGRAIIDPAKVAQGVQLLDKLTGTLERLHQMQRDCWGITKGAGGGEGAATALSRMAEDVRRAAIESAAASRPSHGSVAPGSHGSQTEQTEQMPEQTAGGHGPGAAGLLPPSGDAIDPGAIVAG